MAIIYTTAQNNTELQQILDLQWINLPQNISSKEAKEQGFVTVHHDMELLAAMNVPHPHVIAKDGDKLVGYTLVMLKEFGNKVPILLPFFEKINGLTYRGERLRDVSYFVMGQVCVDKNYRGKGIFAGLYRQMKKEMSSHFQYVITEIATRNIRSIRAHEKVGFETVHIYSTEVEKWAIVSWDWIWGKEKNTKNQ